MSKITFASELQSLASVLADALDAASEDFFAPVTIVVPNRYLKKWLRLVLARRLGVAINLRFPLLEEALWDLFRELDPRAHAVPPEPLEENVYRLLILAVLLEENDPDLDALQRYLQLQPNSLSRLSCRRAWHLAQRLALRFQEYEIHREEPLIRRWVAGEFGLSSAGSFQQLMERSQRALFRHITRPGEGRHAFLNRLGGANFKTFPQYAAELEELPLPPRRGRTIHFFGFSALTELHARVLARLGGHYDLRFYHLNVLASRLPASPQKSDLRAVPAHLAGGGSPGNELLRHWGRAGNEVLAFVANLLESGHFKTEVLEPILGTRPPSRRPAPKRSGATVLARLHAQLLDRSTGVPRRLPQDTSVQIVGCPGAAREVETVHNSILDNLRKNSELRQTDCAVLVTDMTLYRPYLQAVFERPPRSLQFNLVDFAAAGLSTLGQALLGMLDLALETFSRSRVFEVLLNPCFLARLGAERTQALGWLKWAETLGIYQGWDADEKKTHGYPSSPTYAWRLGLQRLRLGRYMEVVGDDADGPAPRFGHVIPFADVDSSDREHLDRFCRAVEGLLPTLAELRTLEGTGRRWANVLQRLVHDFLDVPPGRPEEEQVRDELLASFEKLALWDHIRPAGVVRGLPLALVREYVQGQLAVLEGSHGEFLTGGVTLAALQPMRPIPFQLIYILGLGEALFPGSNALDSFDLRAGPHRLPGDVRPAEARQYQFLENVLAAQQKLYLLYDNYDPVKDQALQPSVTLQQLQRYLGQHVVQGEFKTIDMPADGDDERFVDRNQQPAHQDVRVQCRDAERYRAFAGAERAGRLALDSRQQAELAEKRRQLQVDFAVPADASAARTGPVTVSLGELKRFLQLPAQEILRRHLQVADDEERVIEDDEPLVTPDGAARQLIRHTLLQIAERAGKGDAQDALKSWPDAFAQSYADLSLRSQVPEHAFGDLDRSRLKAELDERVRGQGGFEAFMLGQTHKTFCGPLLLGESMTPLGARLRFPALSVPSVQDSRDAGAIGVAAAALGEVRIVGSSRLVWHSPTSVEVLVITTSKDINTRDLHPSMLEPLLLYLALLANAEPGQEGVNSSAWLAQRQFLLHLARPEGVLTIAYPVGCIKPAEALDYLVQLTRDFLDASQYDLLPFDLLIANTNLELRRAYYEVAGSQPSPTDYAQMLADRLADERAAYYSIRIPQVVDMIQATVPADALAKVRRRFGMLDRGLGLVRQGSGKNARPVTKKGKSHPSGAGTD